MIPPPAPRRPTPLPRGAWWVAALALWLGSVAPPVLADGAVTATPPLQVVPATPVSRTVQQRMRGCNATADGRKLAGAARETFIKNCMAPHRGHGASRPGSEPKTDP